MRSLAKIQLANIQAAEREAHYSRTPFVLWPQDVPLWTAILNKGGNFRFPFPFLRDCRPPEWRLIDTIPCTPGAGGARRSLLRQLKANMAYAWIYLEESGTVLGVFERASQQKRTTTSVTQVNSIRDQGQGTQAEEPVFHGFGSVFHLRKDLAAGKRADCDGCSGDSHKEAK